MLLPSLNSCVNPWIYIYFNPNLITLFCQFFKRKSSSDEPLSKSGALLNNTACGAGGGVGGGGDQKSYGSSLDGMEQPQVIEVSPDQLPVQVHFRTASSRLNVQQSHGGQAMPQVEHASFQVLFFPFFSIVFLLFIYGFFLTSLALY